MTDRQLTGALSLLLIVFLISYLYSSFISGRADIISVPYADRAVGTVVVALEGAERNNGIFFLPDGASVSDLLTLSGQRNLSMIDQRILAARLAPGEKLFVRCSRGQVTGLAIGRMRASSRLALDMPIDLNSSTMEELVLIPGIGEKTAGKIVSYRDGIGGFKRLNELKNVKGIKDKKFAKLAKYFYLESKSRI